MGFEPTTLRDLVGCSTTELLGTLWRARVKPWVLTGTASRGHTECINECKRYHGRLAELLATKLKGESYATTMSWIKARVSFALLRSALLCLRGSRAKRRIHLELPDIDLTWRKDMRIFVKNVDHLLFITFYRFSW